MSTWANTFYLKEFSSSVTELSGFQSIVVKGFDLLVLEITVADDAKGRNLFEDFRTIQSTLIEKAPQISISMLFFSGDTAPEWLGVINEILQQSTLKDFRLSFAGKKNLEEKPIYAADEVPEEALRILSSDLTPEMLPPLKLYSYGKHGCKLWVDAAKFGWKLQAASTAFYGKDDCDWLALKNAISQWDNPVLKLVNLTESNELPVEVLDALMQSEGEVELDEFNVTPLAKEHFGNFTDRVNILHLDIFDIQAFNVKFKQNQYEIQLPIAEALTILEEVSQGSFKNLDTLHIQFVLDDEESVEMSSLVEEVCNALLSSDLKTVEFIVFQNFDINSTEKGKEVLRKAESNRKRVLRKLINKKEKVNYSRQKLMIIGDAGAGKSSTLRSLQKMTFKDDLESTVLAAAQVDLNLSEWRGEDTNLNDEFQAYAVKEKMRGLSNTSSKASFLNEDKNFEENVDKIVVAKEIHNRVEVNPAMNMGEYKNRFGKTTNNPKEKGKKVGMAKRFMNKLRGKKINLNSVEEMDDDDFDWAVDIGALANDSSKLTVWDFGGQEVFFTLHHLYLTDNGIYLLVFPMNNFESLEGAKRELEKIKRWLSSVYLHAPDSKVILVGTKLFLCNAIENEAITNTNRKLNHFSQDLANIFGIVERNDESNLLFFPIDNSANAAGEKYMLPLRKKILELKTTMKREVLMSSMYFMNGLFSSGRVLISGNELRQKAAEMNVSPQLLEETIKFYSEVGAIVSFLETETPVAELLKERENLDEEPTVTVEAVQHSTIGGVVVLKPEWLLHTFGKFIFDHEVHNRDYYNQMVGNRHALTKMFESYKATGIIAESLLDMFLGQNFAYKKELLYIAKVGLVLSKLAVVNQKDFANSIDNESFWIVPCMNKESLSLEEKEKEIGDLTAYVSVYITFAHDIPRGVFERTLCLLLNCALEIDGIRDKSVVYNNAAKVFFRKYEVVMILNEAKREILFRLAPGGYEEYGSGFLLEAASTVWRGLMGDEIGQHLNPLLEVEIFWKEKFYRKLWFEIIETVKINDENPKFRFESIENRKQMELVPHSEVKELFEVAKKTLDLQSVSVVELPTAIARPTGTTDPNANGAPLPVSHNPSPAVDLNDPETFHVFLAHTWGPNDATHNRVKEIAEGWRDQGVTINGQPLRYFLDEGNLTGVISLELMNALLKSKAVIVFISKEYIERANDTSTHVFKEFHQALKKGEDNIIPVILDKHYMSARNWPNPSVLDYHVFINGQRMYFDFHSKEKERKNQAAVINKIEEICNKP